MIITDFGDTGVFEHRDVEKPKPKPTELLVRAHASSVNPVDCMIREVGEWAGREHRRHEAAQAAGHHPRARGRVGTAYQHNYTVEMLFSERDRRPIDALRRLVEAGRLEPVIDSVLPLEEVARAHEVVEGSILTGKVVLDVAGE